MQILTHFTNTMSSIDYKKRMEKALKDSKGILSALIDYEIVFPELNQEAAYTTFTALKDYISQLRTPKRGNQQFLYKWCLTFYAMLPIPPRYMSYSPPDELETVKRQKLDFPSNTSTNDNAIHNKYSFIKVSRLSRQIDDRFFETYLNQLDAEMIHKQLWDFNAYLPISCGDMVIKKESDAEVLFQQFLVAPLIYIFNESLQGVVGSPFRRETHTSFTLNLDDGPFHISTDLAIFYQNQLLVNIEMKLPSIKDAVFNKDGQHFTRLLTQVFYEGVAGGTTYNVLSDYEYTMFLQICLEQDQETFDAGVFGEEGITTIEDVGVPLLIRYRLFHRSAAKLTVFKAFIAFAYAAYHHLIVQGKKEEVSKYLLELAAKLKLDGKQKMMRISQDCPQLRRDTKAIFTHLSGTGVGFEFFDVVSELDDWTEISVTSSRGQRHAQVYRHNTDGTILKVFDPRKSPREKLPYELRKEAVLDAFSTELVVYHKMQSSALSVTPQLCSQGFILLEGTDSTYGPFLQLKDVGGEPPDMESVDDVRLIMTAYKTLLQSGVVHGDIKEDNIRLVEDRTKAMFFDFGFSSVSKAFFKTGRAFHYSKGCSEWRQDREELKRHWEKDLSDATSNLSRDDQTLIISEFQNMFEDCFKSRVIRSRLASSQT